MSDPPPTPVETLEYRQAGSESSRFLATIGFAGLIVSLQRIASALLFISTLQAYATYPYPTPLYQYIWIIAYSVGTAGLGIALAIASFGLLRMKPWAIRLLQNNEKCAVIFFLLSDVFEQIREAYMLNHGQTSNWGLVRGFLGEQSALLLYMIFPLMALLLTQTQPITRLFNAIQSRMCGRQ
jgi:hypothetical protein